jgi:hypothetical protein
MVWFEEYFSMFTNTQSQQFLGIGTSFRQIGQVGESFLAIRGNDHWLWLLRKVSHDFGSMGFQVVMGRMVGLIAVFNRTGVMTIGVNY